MPEIKATNIKNHELEKRVSKTEKTLEELIKIVKKDKKVVSEYKWYDEK